MKRGFPPIADIALILLLAVALGVSWNHTMLLKAWRGEASSPPPPSQRAAAGAPAAGQGAQEEVPLPLGLMQVKEMYDSKEAAIVDARDAETFAAGHIKGAISLPLGEAAKGAPPWFREKVAPEKAVIVYCNGFSCHDSIELGKLLMKWGYRTVYVYEGGYPEWHDAGYPVEQGGKR